MGSKRVTFMITLAAALILTGQPAQAQGHPRGGGHRGGGGHHGGSYAVPRGSGGYGGGGAYGRHPRAGTGGYGYHHGGYGGGYYGHRGYYGHGGYYGHHGYGYYPYYGYGYYRPYGYASFYFGSPYWGIGWGWPYAGGYYPSYQYSPSPYYYGNSDPPARESERRYDEDRYSSDRPSASEDAGRLRLDIRPDDASVYVNDRFVGNAREARQLTLRAGPHSVEVVRPGYETARREVEVTSGETSELRLDLQHR